MTRLISRAESWEKVYEAFSQINFTAFDYNSIKQSITDYMKLYFPESFNDFIESDELIAQIEVFAYLGELLIYRVDVSSHENFIGVAQRKQNVLRLAKLISYKTTRNLPARGLLKFTSISTTEDLYDTQGNSLKGRTVSWNDINNTQWKEQFMTVLNAACLTNIGTVNPNDRVQVDNVLFELYSFNNIYPQRGVFPYAVSVNGSNYDMEIVPSSIDQFGPYERRPEYGSSFTFLYGSDGFGNDSPTTGFFLLTKQGRITNSRYVFDGKTPNQYIELSDQNINDIDLWVNNIDPVTEAITNDGSIRHKRSGEWEEVDTTSAQNVIFSYTSGRNRYETETLEDDRVRIAFGDGEFANIPSGTFDIWYRKSINENLTIPINAVVDKEFSLTYTDKQGLNQTLTYTVSLISNIQNASASEDVEHIRRVAPGTYYTQNRMVNGADYNLYPLQNPTILKLKTVNRTYTGQSKFSHWHDATDTYENVKLAGNDLNVLFEDLTNVDRINDPINVDKLFANHITPVLSSIGFYTWRYVRYVTNIRRSFNVGEIAQIKDVLNNNNWPDPVWIVYDSYLDVFTATNQQPTEFIIRVDATTVGGQVVGWVVSSVATKMVVESPTTYFWYANGNVTIPYDTIVPQRDTVVILKENTNSTEDGILADDIPLATVGVVLDPLVGLQEVSKLEVIATDLVNNDLSGVSVLDQLLDPVYVINPSAPTPITIPVLPPTVVPAPTRRLVMTVLVNGNEATQTTIGGNTISSGTAGATTTVKIDYNLPAGYYDSVWTGFSTSGVPLPPTTGPVIVSTGLGSAIGSFPATIEVGVQSFTLTLYARNEHYQAGSISVIVAVSGPADTAHPPVRAPVFTDCTPSSFLVKWYPPTLGTPTGYKVVKHDLVTGAVTVVATTPNNVTSYNATGLLFANTAYLIGIMADYSGTLSAETLITCGTSPYNPSNLRIVSTTATTATVGWDVTPGSDDTTYYNVSWTAPSVAPGYGGNSLISPRENRWTFTAAEGTSGFVKLYATNGSDLTKNSVTLSVPFQMNQHPILFYAPVTDATISGTNTSLTLNWITPVVRSGTTLIGYTVKFFSNVPGGQITLGLVNTYTFIDDIVTGTVYYMEITANYSDGNSSVSRFGPVSATT